MNMSSSFFSRNVEYWINVNMSSNIGWNAEEDCGDFRLLLVIAFGDGILKRSMMIILIDHIVRRFK